VTFTFSDRLSGATAIIIYLALMIGFSPPVMHHIQLEGSAAAFWVMLTAVVIYGLCVTLMWRWCMCRRSISILRLYFIGQFLLLLAMFWLENADTHDGASVGNLGLILLLQSGTLNLREKIVCYFVAGAGMIGISLLYLPLQHVVMPALLVFASNGGIMLIGHLIVRDEAVQIALQRANRKLAEYADQVDELATIRERNRLAREIHDNLGHYLTVVNTQIEAARAVMSVSPERSDYLLERAQTLTREGLSEVRRSVAALRSSPTEAYPLHEAIQRLVDEHIASGLSITYVIKGPVRTCHPGIEMALYRAAQEGLTNVRKHAQAESVDVCLSYMSAEQIELTIHDDGKNTPGVEPGFGLMGLQERFKLLHGILKTQAIPNEGFTLEVEVPT
jgi:signal transduction histidine kinase